jgi:CHAT domain-containing protein
MIKTIPALFIISSIVHFQLSAQNETALTGYRITEIKNPSKSKYAIRIEHGKDMGLENGMEGEVWGIARKDVAGHVANLGIAKVTEIGDSYLIAECACTQTVYAGDLFYINSIFPSHDYRSPYYYLTLYAIDITDDEGQPFHSFDEIIQRDGHALQTEKFLRMQSHVRKTAESLQAKGDSRKIKGGPHAGSLVVDVALNTDTLDIWRYVYYKFMTYMETMGQRYKLSEDYIAYVEDGDWITADQLWETVMSTDTASLENVYAQYKRRITSVQLISWIDKAREIAKEGNYEQADGDLTRLIRLAAFNGDPMAQGEALYLKAAIFYVYSKFDEAIAYYKLADRQYAKIPDNGKRASTLHYIGLSYKEIRDYSSAVKQFDEAIAFREQSLKKSPDSESGMEELYTSVLALAELQSSMNNYEASEKSYRKALALAITMKDTGRRASCLWNIGYIAELGSRKTEALELYRNAAALYLDTRDTASVIELMRNQGLIHNTGKEYTRSFEIADKALGLARNWGKPYYIGLMQQFLGNTLEATGDTQRALAAYLAAEKSFDDAGNAVKSIETRKKTASVYVLLQQYQNALKKHEERFPLAGDNLSRQADVYWDIAYLFGENLLQHKKAITNYSHCEALYKQLNDTSNLNIIYANLAHHFRNLNDSVRTYRCHDQALTLTAEHANRSEYAYASEKAAKSYGHFGNRKKERLYYKTASDIYRQKGETANEARVTEAMAESLGKMAKYEEAAEAYKKSIALYRQANDKPNEAETYWDYAYMVGNSQNQYEKAIGLYQIALAQYLEIPDSVNASTMLSNIGQNYWSLFRYDKAIEYHSKAIDLASRSKNVKQVAKSWSKLATLYSESNNPVASFEALKNSLTALQTVNDSIELASTYNDIANSYIKAKDYTNGFSHFQKSLAIRKAKKDTLASAACLFDMAAAYQTRLDYKQGEKYYLESLRLRKAIKDRAGEIYCLANLGAMAVATPDYKKAQAYLDEAVQIAKAINDNYILAYCYARLKSLYRSIGNAAKSDECNTLALKLFEKEKRWKDMASTLVDIGYDAHYVYGDVKSALSYFDKAQLMADTLNDKQIQAAIFSSRSSVYRETGEFDKALEMAQKSLTLYREVDNNWGVAGTYIDLGNIYKQFSEFETAINYQNKADSLYIVLGLDYSRLAPLANLGENYTAQGDYKKGLDYYLQSLSIMEKAGDHNENLAIIKACVGEAHFYLNDFAAADKWLREAITICEKVGANRAKADNLSVMGRLKIEEKKYNEALKFLNEGVGLAKSHGMTIAYLNNILLIGKAEAEQMHFDKAKPPLEECVKLSKSIGKRSTLWESLYLLGVLYKNAGDLATSREYLKESITVIELIRNKVSGGEEARKLFSSDKQILKVYDVLIDVLLQLGDTEQAMEYLQKNNENNLKAKFKGLDVKFEDEKRNRALEEEKNMKARLDGLEEQIAREKVLAASKQNAEKLKNLEGIKTIAESEYLKFINQQINVQPELSRYFNNSVQPTQFRKIKKQIPRDMALLSYLIGENQVYIFAATSDTVIAKIVTVPAETITKNVNAVLNITKSQLGTFSPLDLKNEETERREIVNQLLQNDALLKPFEELYHYLIRPVNAEIAGKKRLGIIPTGSLNYVPFQLLGKTLPSGKLSLLANQYAIFYTSSTDMLFRLIENEEKTMSILAFGNPDKSLPSTELEVQDIKKIFPSATVYLRDEATEDKAKFAGEQYNVMHFATHGNLDYEDFSQSFLTMAGNPSKSEDGKLTLEELWGMDVMNHLNIVVLSACQTAVSKGSHESSPVSPASGFLQNGVKSVVATLWKVDDEATSILISDFYKNLRNMDAVDALRSAQITLSQKPKYAHPYYWAGIVLLGDWR